MQNNKKWSNEALTSSIGTIEDGRKIKEASEDFGILLSTLRAYLMGTIQSRKKGNKLGMSE